MFESFLKGYIFSHIYIIKLKSFFLLYRMYNFSQKQSNTNQMIEIELKDFQVGKTYYLHHVKDEDTHRPLEKALKYKVVCTADYSFSDWYEFGFDSVKGINTEDIPGRISISIDEDAWGMYKYYLCESDAIIVRVIDRVMINAKLREIIGDPYFKFY